MKAHYRQPDYEIYAGQLESLLGRIRAALTQRHRRVKRTKSFILSLFLQNNKKLDLVLHDRLIISYHLVHTLYRQVVLVRT